MSKARRKGEERPAYESQPWYRRHLRQQARELYLTLTPLAVPLAGWPIDPFLPLPKRLSAAIEELCLAVLEAEKSYPEQSSAGAPPVARTITGLTRKEQALYEAEASLPYLRLEGPIAQLLNVARGLPLSANLPSALAASGACSATGNARRKSGPAGDPDRSATRAKSSAQSSGGDGRGNHKATQSKRKTHV